MLSVRGLCVSCVLCVLCETALGAQLLLDRVLARVGTEAITQTDVQALVEFGLIEAKSSTEPAAVQPAIDRRLTLNEVARFPPSEPPSADVEQQLAAMKARVGDRLDEVMRATGLDEDRLRGMARDTLRIRSYVQQRFGITAQVGEEEARKYFEGHRDEFTRNGMPLTFEEAAAEARQRAAAARIQSAIAQWLQDLRGRSDVVLVMSTSPSTPPAAPRAN
jgi:Asp-tRNA(Asn)/Glu-tRNA(Gln) amidotransferase A subunit family amidase